MRLRYPVLTLLIVIAALASPAFSGSGWTIVIGLWVACLPAFMAMLDNDGSVSDYLPLPVPADAADREGDRDLREAA